MANRSRSFFWLFLGLALVPLLLVGTPREVAKFHVARSRNAELAGDMPGAEAAVDHAIAWDPEEPAWLVRRAELRLQRDQVDDALRDLARARRLPGAPSRLVHVEVDALLAAGKPAEALRRWKAYLDSIEPVEPQSPFQSFFNSLIPGLEEQAYLRQRLEEASTKNATAYFRALAGVELDEALDDSLSAIKLIDDEQARVDPKSYLRLSAGRSMRGTRKSPQALSWLQDAVLRLRDTTHRLQIRATAVRLIQGRKQQQIAVRRVAVAKAMLRSAHYELAGEYVAQGMMNQAALQLDQVERLGGKKDDESQAWHMTLPLALGRIAQLGAFLDTLATVQWRQGRHQAALKTIGEAIELAEATHEAAPWWLDLVNHEQLDVRQEEHQARAFARSLAIYHYRRSRIRQELGDEQGAAADRKAVEYLGFEPSDRLQ